MTALPYRTSCWIDRDPDRRPTLETDVACDVAIIGGGFAGLSVAYHIKQAAPDANVIVLEADFCGAGASGKSQGIPCPHTPDDQGILRKVLGPEGLRRYCQLEIELFDQHEAFIREQHIECEYERSKAAWVVTTDAQQAYAERLVGAYDEGGFPYRRLSQDEARHALNIPVAWGIEFGTDVRADFNPYAFTRGLMERVLESAVTVYEGTPVREIKAGIGPTTLETSGGAVVADHVVVAANAYAANFDLVADLVVPQRAYSVLTAPLGDREAEQVGWSGEHRLINEIDPGFLFRAHRFMRDGSLFFVIGGDSFDHPTGSILQNDNESALRLVQKELVARFPLLAEVPLTAAWGAALDVSATHYPLIGRLTSAENIYVAIGFSGHGIVQAFQSGPMLRGLILGPEHMNASHEEVRQAYRAMSKTVNDRIA